MASLADLNVRLGLIYKDFDKGLESVERKLRSSGRRLSDLGDQLTVSFSLPLAAAGAAAVKSAGDIESLTLALESQLGSTEEARKELELLRQEALKPGLGFEQAVRASVSLQAVGFEAEKARKITSEFGNALALAGKGAAELDGVVLALTQITAKGIVSAEEINQIAERLPQIRTLMQQAFGTASTEAIQKLGITSQQFIEDITGELQKLSRAAGGNKNALESFFDAIKVGAAKFGDAISKALDLPNTLGNLSAGLLALADGFANLNPEVQQFIIYAGAAVVAAGPLAKVFGAIQSSGAQLIGIMQGAFGLLKGGASTVLGLTDAFNRLKLALGIVGIVAAVGAAVFALADRFDAAAYAQERFEEGQRAVIEQTGKEIGLLNQNFDALKKEGLRRVEKGKIIDQLIAQYPTYLRGIDLESASVSELTKIQKGLNDQILRGVAERQKAAAITGLYEKQAQILLRIQQLRDGAQATAGEATLIDFGDQLRAGSIAGAVIEKLQQQSDELGRQVGVTASQFDKAFGTMNRAIDPTLEQEYKARDAYYAARDAQEERVATANKATGAIRSNNLALGESNNLAKTYKEVLSDIANVSAQQDLLGSDRVIEQAKAIEAGIKKLLDAGFKPASVQVQQLKKDLQGLFTGIKGPELPDAPTLPTLQTPTEITSIGGEDKFKSLAASVVIATEKLVTFKSVTQQLGEVNLAFQGGLIGFNQAFAQTAELVAANGTLMQQAILGAAASMQEAATDGASSFGQLASAAATAAGKVVRAWIQQGVAAAVAKALGGLPFPFNIAAGAAAGALAAAAFNKALSAIKVPGFAQGTNFAPGGLALVGEQGPELVKLPRGSQVTPNNELQRMVGGGDNFMVTHKIQGSDLLFIIERAQSQSKRVRGF